MLGYKCNGLDVLVLTGPLVHLFLFSTICWTRPSNPVWNSPSNHSCSCIKGMPDIIITWLDKRLMRAGDWTHDLLRRKPMRWPLCHGAPLKDTHLTFPLHTYRPKNKTGSWRGQTWINNFFDPKYNFSVFFFYFWVFFFNFWVFFFYFWVFFFVVVG